MQFKAENEVTENFYVKDQENEISSRNIFNNFSSQSVEKFPQDFFSSSNEETSLINEFLSRLDTLKRSTEKHEFLIKVY